MSDEQLATNSQSQCVIASALLSELDSPIKMLVNKMKSATIIALCSLVILHLPLIGAEVYYQAVSCKSTRTCQLVFEINEVAHCHNGYCKCKDGDKMTECPFLPDYIRKKVDRLPATCPPQGEDCLAIPNAMCDRVADHHSKPGCRCKDNYTILVNGNKTSCIEVVSSLGAECKSHKQCRYGLGPESHCPYGFCECKPGFYGTKDKKRCIFQVINSPCTSDNDCPLSGAFCKNGEKSEPTCQCKANMVANQENSACLPLQDGIGAPCSESQQCNQTLGAHAHCERGVCQCTEGHRWYKNLQCTATLSYGDRCDTALDLCYATLAPGAQNVLYCNNDYCDCKRHFIIDPYKYECTQKKSEALLSPPGARVAAVSKPNYFVTGVSFICKLKEPFYVAEQTCSAEEAPVPYGQVQA